MFDALRARYAARARARRLAQITPDWARERAARGAAFLDTADPGWASRLNPATLELADGQACVLGQLHGDYRLGLLRSRVLDFSSAPLASLSPHDLGFQAIRDVDEAAQDLDYALLTRAWRSEISRRRPAPVAGPSPKPAHRTRPSPSAA